MGSSRKQVQLQESRFDSSFNFSLSEQTLKSMKKDDVVNLYLKLQAEFDKSESLAKKLDQAITDLVNINDRFNKLESSLAVSHNTSTHLCNRIVDLERNLHAVEQYSRRECVEITGINDSISDSALQREVINILQSINVSCNDVDVEACHRLKNRDRTIVKFSSRRKVHEIFSKKKTLKEQGSRLYINESLCPYYRGIWGKCKKMKLEKKIWSFWTSNGSIRVKLSENSRPNIITHDVDLARLFNKETTIVDVE